MSTDDRAAVFAAVNEEGEEQENLWHEFAEADGLEDYAQCWLELQTQMLGDVRNGMVLLAVDDAPLAPMAFWPRQGCRPERLADIVERAIEQRCGLVAELGQKGCYGIAFPVQSETGLLGVVAFEVSARTQALLPQLMGKVQWGISWLELAIVKRAAKEDKVVLKRLKAAVDLLAIVLGQNTFKAAAIALATEVAKALNCERASLGVLKGRNIRIEAVSHSSAVAEKMNLTRSIERVMDEALLQRRDIVYPLLTDEGQIYREHEALSRQQSMISLLSCQLYSGERYFGVLTCERPADNPFNETDLAFIQSIAALTGPALEAKFYNDRSLLAKSGDELKSQLGRFWGVDYLGRKLLLTAFLLLALFLFRAEGLYRLTADTVLEGSIQQAIVAPYDGYIADARVRAGDLVEEGEILCSLDDRELRLEKLAKESELRQLESKFQATDARHEWAESTIIKAQKKQLQAQLDLLNARLERTLMTTPFAGLVVSGDLSQRLGSAVEKGEVLFEVTPLDRYRVILEVDERRITDVKVDQQGVLVLSALPSQQIAFAIDKITPITTAEDGRNFFRVEASLLEEAENLRPGMEGIGKISIDRRKLISIWSRDLIDWLRLVMWNWLP